MRLSAFSSRLGLQRVDDGALTDSVVASRVPGRNARATGAIAAIATSSGTASSTQVAASKPMSKARADGGDVAAQTCSARCPAGGRGRIDSMFRARAEQQVDEHPADGAEPPTTTHRRPASSLPAVTG